MLSKPLKSMIWHRPEEVLPQDGANILCYHWYDGPHYFQGIYHADTQEVEYELPDDDRCDINLIEYWMIIPEIEQDWKGIYEFK